MNTVFSQVTWDVVRAGGFTAYLLLTAAVVLGLLLSLRWQSRRWPRLVTNDMHNHLALLALAFGVVHGVASMLDPFMQFHLSEVLVPLASHYRPTWMAFGIVSFYLGIAILLSTWLRPRIGYKAWRAFHGVTFLAFAFAGIHGIGTGSDTRAPWAMAIYGLSFVTVLTLTTWRLLSPTGQKARPRPVVAALGVAAAVAISLWSWRGPLQAGWNRIANHGNGSGARIVLASNRTRTETPLPTRFTARFQGTLTASQSFQGADAAIRGRLTGAVQGHLQVLLQGEPTPGGTIAVIRSQVALYHPDGTAAYVGTLRSAQGQTLSAHLTPVGGSGPGLLLELTWSLAGRSVSGSVVVNPLSDG